MSRELSSADKWSRDCGNRFDMFGPLKSEATLVEAARAAVAAFKRARTWPERLVVARDVAVALFLVIGRYAADMHPISTRTQQVAGVLSRAKTALVQCTASMDTAYVDALFEILQYGIDVSGRSVVPHQRLHLHLVQMARDDFVNQFVDLEKLVNRQSEAVYAARSQQMGRPYTHQSSDAKAVLTEHRVVASRIFAHAWATHVLCTGAVAREIVQADQASTPTVQEHASVAPATASGKDDDMEAKPPPVCEAVRTVADLAIADLADAGPAGAVFAPDASAKVVPAVAPTPTKVKKKAKATKAVARKAKTETEKTETEEKAETQAETQAALGAQTETKIRKRKTTTSKKKKMETAAGTVTETDAKTNRVKKTKVIKKVPATGVSTKTTTIKETSTANVTEEMEATTGPTNGPTTGPTNGPTAEANDVETKAPIVKVVKTKAAKVAKVKVAKVAKVKVAETAQVKVAETAEATTSAASKKTKAVKQQPTAIAKTQVQATTGTGMDVKLETGKVKKAAKAKVVKERVPKVKVAEATTDVATKTAAMETQATETKVIETQCAAVDAAKLQHEPPMAAESTVSAETRTTSKPPARKRRPHVDNAVSQCTVETTPVPCTAPVKRAKRKTAVKAVTVDMQADPATTGLGKQ
jgi:hypothetical protein